jgi:hypothetical protein
MDNNILTGVPKIDKAMILMSWLLGIIGLISLKSLPIILSCIASVMVMINQYIIYKNRPKK